MASLTVKKSEVPSMLSRMRSNWDPFEALGELLHLSPSRELSRMLPELSFAPAFEVKETPEAYVFSADVPGVQEKDIELICTGNRLTVSGRREAEKENKSETYYTYERTYGAFARSFTLPDDVQVEACRADLKQGVLTIYVPKAVEARATRIPISALEKTKA